MDGLFRLCCPSQGPLWERVKLKAGSKDVQAMEQLERLHGSMFEWTVNRMMYVVLL